MHSDDLNPGNGDPHISGQLTRQSTKLNSQHSKHLLKQLSKPLTSARVTRNGVKQMRAEPGKTD